MRYLKLCTVILIKTFRSVKEEVTKPDVPHMQRLLKTLMEQLFFSVT